MNFKELQLFETIDELMISCLDGDSVSVEHVTSLTLDNEEDIDDDDNTGNLSGEAGPSQGGETSTDVDFDYKRRVVDYWVSGKRKNLSFETVQKKFRRLCHESHLYLRKKHVDQGGTQQDKFKFIAQECKKKFDETYQSSTRHDVTIKQWAMQSALAHNLPSFKASYGWLYNFKSNFGITSRKVTTVLTKKKIDKQDQIMADAEMFVEKVREKIVQHGQSHVFNSDQSGFNLEIYNGRTLAYKGGKSIETVVQSVGSTTHSYTIMPTVSADGDLLSPMLIILKEKDGVFGPRVKEHFFSHESIHVTCTKSGKMGTAEVQAWHDKTIVPNLPEGQNILLLDAFSGHKKVTTAPGLEVMNIPAGATGVCQPFDVYGFRIWKTMIRLSAGLRLLNSNLQLHHRNTILKLQSLILFHFMSPRFKKMWKYSWYRSGYIDEDPGHFAHPVKYCLNGVGLTCVLCTGTSVGFLKCSWCSKDLCVEHLYDEHHYCKNYVS